MSQTAKIDKLITLQNLKEFYGLLQDNFIATENKYGAIKVGYSGSGQNYPVKLDNSGKAYVNVPWGYNPATARTDGLMSSTDKAKLDDFKLGSAENNKYGGFRTGYEENGRNYAVRLDGGGKAYVSVPWTDTDTKYNLTAAKDNELGGIKIGYNNGQANTANKNYPVQLDGNNKAYVNVPWTDTNTTYTLSAASKTELGGIKIGYNGGEADTTSKNYPVKLDNNNKAYVNVSWNDTTYTFGTGLAVTDGQVRANVYNVEPSNKEATSNNKYYPVSLDKNGKLAVEVPWTDTIRGVKESYGISLDGNNLKLDLYEYRVGTATAVLENIKLSTAIEPASPNQYEEEYKHSIYPVCLDKNSKLAVRVPWKNTWQENSKTTDGYVPAPPKDDYSLKVWMTSRDGHPSWQDIPEPTVTVPQASDVVLGGIKLGYDNTLDSAHSNNRRYGVQICSDEAQKYKAFVEIGTASKENVGVVKIGTTTSTEIAVQINDEGVLYVAAKDIPAGGSFELGSATDSKLGGIMVGYNGGKADDTNKKYPVQLDNEIHAFVNVPWKNTTYTFGSGVAKDNNNKVYLDLKDSNKTTDEIQKNINWGIGSTISDNAEYFACPVYLDKNGQLYVRVPIVKEISIGTDNASPIQNSEE